MILKTLFFLPKVFLAIVFSYLLVLIVMPAIAMLDYYGITMWALTCVLLALVFVAAVIVFWIQKKTLNKRFAVYFIGVYWLVILTAPSLVFMEAWYQLRGDKAGFAAEYGYLEKLEKLELTNQFIADSIGITIANSTYYNEFEPDVYINSSGFRSREFNDTCMGNPRLLFLGDSFLWGLSAKPLDASFSDVLGKHYCTFNTGIIGAGLAQYKAIVEQYFNEINPQFTCLFLYIGNDLLRHQPKLRPFVPNHFWTKNMGFSSEHIDACGDKIYFDSPDLAYQHYMEHYSLLASKNWFVKDVLAKTHIGTKVYFALTNQYDDGNCGIYTETIYTSKYLQDIKQTVEGMGGRFLLFVIPEKINLITDAKQFSDSYGAHFEGISPFVPYHFTFDDYANGADEHFNNQGHLKFAQFVSEVLDNELSQYIK